MIHVVAIITAKPGKRDEVLKNFKANVPAVHAEKGCIEYGATVDTDGSFTVRGVPDGQVSVSAMKTGAQMRHSAPKQINVSGGAAPFVEIGARVAQGQTILIIEAMKTMNHIPAPKAGVVTAILVGNGQPVEFGEPLAIIE